MWPIEADTVAKVTVAIGATAVIIGLCIVERYERAATAFMLIGCTLMWISAGVLAT